MHALTFWLEFDAEATRSRASFRTLRGEVVVSNEPSYPSWKLCFFNLYKSWFILNIQMDTQQEVSLVTMDNVLLTECSAKMSQIQFTLGKRIRSRSTSSDLSHKGCQQMSSLQKHSFEWRTPLSDILHLCIFSLCRSIKMCCLVVLEDCAWKFVFCLQCHHYQPNPCVSPDTGQGGVPKGAKTSEYYRVDNIPTRFNNPGNFDTCLDLHVSESSHFLKFLLTYWWHFAGQLEKDCNRSMFSTATSLSY